MRYAIVSKGLTVSQIQAEAQHYGAQNIKVLPVMEQVFCDLDPEAANRLSQVDGLAVKLVTRVKPTSLIAPPEAPTAAGVRLNLFDVYNELRQSISPPLYGSGLTVAVLDTGVRSTHEALTGKVVHEANFTISPTLSDLFGHGTSVAYIIAGGNGAKSGVAPDAMIMNIKVLRDDGEGTDETVIDGFEEVCGLVAAARGAGLHPTDEMYPNTINLSAGMDDDGDPDNPLRVACRIARLNYGLQVLAAAGNSGPYPGTILSPAVDLNVIAVGGLKSWEFTLWDLSSRGPTIEGIVKPDLVCWAEDIEAASHESDTEYVGESGTSFSCPILVGVDGLLWDLTRRIYGEDVRVTYYDWLPYATAYCMKPEGIAAEKDNDYGFGIPSVGSMSNKLMRPTTPITSVLQNAMMIMLMSGMMGIAG